ncbi:MAG: FIST C-terminal domain-containing protein, partial [Deltaproteobacteria bacterium]|nr:FIST C-terminal domain-containing protein [Deltaproteobacteria bacterium]
AMTMSAKQMRVGVGLSTRLSTSPLSAGHEAAIEACRALGIEPTGLKRHRHVAVCLIDGRSGKEESFIAGAAAAVPSIGIVGGSASDELGGPPRTRIIANGAAIEGAGLVLLFETTIPFSVVVSEHMVPTDKRVVVTDSDPGTRTVHELNGRPAVEVYQELIQQPVDNQVAARKPLAQYLGGRAYIRSVMEVQGTSLRFACAVENGVILRLVEPGNIIERTAESLGEAEAEVGGEIGALIAFNCLGRFLEVEATGQTAELARLIGKYPVVGFNTFGEQAGALHVNHTLTALAFGRGAGG